MIVLVKEDSFLSVLVTQHLPNKISRRRRRRRRSDVSGAPNENIV